MVGVSRTLMEEAVVSTDSFDRNDCSDPSVYYIQGSTLKLERFYKRITGLEVLRLVMNVASDWKSFSYNFV